MDQAQNSNDAWRRRLGQAAWVLERTQYALPLKLFSAGLWPLILILLIVFGTPWLQALGVVLVLALGLTVWAAGERITHGLARAYLQRSGLLAGLLGGEDGLRAWCAERGASLPPREDEGALGTAEQLKWLMRLGTREMLRARPPDGWLTARRVLCWTCLALCGGTLLAVVAALALFERSYCAPLDFLVRHLELVLAFALGLSPGFLIPACDILNRRLVGALKRELGAALIKPPDFRRPGSLGWRFRRAHGAAGRSLLTVCTIAGAAPAVFLLYFYFASVRNDYEDPAIIVLYLPLILATLWGWTLAMLELGAWRRDLRRFLDDGMIMVPLAEQALHQPGPDRARRTDWEQRYARDAAAEDPVQVVARRMSEYLKRSLPAGMKRAVGRRLLGLWIMFAAGCLALTGIFWQQLALIAELDSMIMLSICLITPAHFGLLLALVRTRLPRVEILACFRRNL